MATLSDYKSILAVECLENQFFELRDDAQVVEVTEKWRIAALPVSEMMLLQFSTARKCIRQNLEFEFIGQAAPTGEESVRGRIHFRG